MTLGPARPPARLEPWPPVAHSWPCALAMARTRAPCVEQRLKAEHAARGPAAKWLRRGPCERRARCRLGHRAAQCSSVGCNQREALSAPASHRHGAQTRDRLAELGDSEQREDRVCVCVNTGREGPATCRQGGQRGSLYLCPSGLGKARQVGGHDPPAGSVCLAYFV